jgi:heat-inducible transcriptional repressor
VQNHLLLTERDYTISELAEAALFLNRHGAGRSLEAVAREVETELHYLQGHIANLMGAAIVAGQSTLGLQQSVMVTGEKNLLNSDDLSANLANLRQLFDLFEHKTELLQLLNLSREAHGVHIFIGEESGLNTLDGCSVITAPYRMNGQVVGTLGVVGPTRMAYERVIPIVDITARLVSSALSYPAEA